MNFILPNGNDYIKGNPKGLELAHPDLKCPGVYIIGIKANIDENGNLVKGPDNEKKFLPFYLGMVKPGSSLISRILRHYKDFSSIRRSTVVGLFNFSLDTNACRIYDALEIFNKVWIEPGYNGGTRTLLERWMLYIGISAVELLNQYLLIFFQCQTSYQFKLPVAYANANLINFKSHTQAYNIFLGAEDPVSTLLAGSYKKTKDNIRDNFYFVYLPMCDAGINDIFLKEAEAKYFLQKNYGIYTQNQLERGHPYLGLWTGVFMQPPVLYPNPFNFNLPVGNCLDIIILKRNSVCHRNPILDKLYKAIETLILLKKDIGNIPAVQSLAILNVLISTPKTTDIDNCVTFLITKHKVLSHQLYWEILKCLPEEKQLELKTYTAKNKFLI